MSITVHPQRVLRHIGWADSPLGAPGAGKGTLSKRLAEDHDFTHISVGDLLRESVDDEPSIMWQVEMGKLLPMKYLLPRLRTAFLDSPGGCTIIVDGFPRRADQVRAFEKTVGKMPSLIH